VAALAKEKRPCHGAVLLRVPINEDGFRRASDANYFRRERKAALNPDAKKQFNQAASCEPFARRFHLMRKGRLFGRPVGLRAKIRPST